MKAVILAAGKGTRMGDLTLDTPKPMLRVHGKTLLEHKLENLPSGVTEVIIVIGYLGEKIRQHVGETYANLPIRYIEQKEFLGTGHALSQCREALGVGKFLVLMGDDLYARSDLEKMCAYHRAMLVQKTDTPVKGGLMRIQDEMIAGISEGGEPMHGSIYTGACLIDQDIFRAELQKVTPTSGEFGLPQTIVHQLATHPIQAVEADSWIRITAPEDLAEAERVMG